MVRGELDTYSSKGVLLMKKGHRRRLRELACCHDLSQLGDCDSQLRGWVATGSWEGLVVRLIEKKVHVAHLILTKMRTES